MTHLDIETNTSEAPALLQTEALLRLQIFRRSCETRPNLSSTDNAASQTRIHRMSSRHVICCQNRRNETWAPRSLLEILLFNDGGEYSGVVKRLQVWFLILVAFSNQ